MRIIRSDRVGPTGSIIYEVYVEDEYVGCFAYVYSFASPVVAIITTDSPKLGKYEDVRIFMMIAIQTYTFGGAANLVIGQPGKREKYQCSFINRKEMTIIKAYEQWYDRYITGLSKGEIILHTKPPCTFNTYILFGHVRFYGPHVGEYTFRCVNGVYAISDNISVTPIVKTYRYVEGKIQPVEFHNPDDETCDTQYSAYHVSVDIMRSAMLKNKSYCDIEFI